MRLFNKLLISVINAAVEAGEHNAHAISGIGINPFSAGQEGDTGSLIYRIGIGTGRNCRESDAVQMMLACQVQAILVAVGQLQSLLNLAIINRAYSMNNVACRQVIAIGNLGSTSRAAA